MTAVISRRVAEKALCWWEGRSQRSRRANPATGRASGESAEFAIFTIKGRFYTQTFRAPDTPNGSCVGEHSCATPLTLILLFKQIRQAMPPTKTTAKAADKSVRPTLTLVSRGMRDSRVLVDHAAFHHEINMLQCAHVGQGIGIDGNDIRVLASLDGTNTLGPPDQIGGA